MFLSNLGKSKIHLSPGMSSQERKYLDFHHSPPEAVTPPRCASGHSEPRSPCLSTPININLIGAPPAAGPWGEKPARSRGVRSTAAHIVQRDCGMLSGGRLRYPCPAAPSGPAPEAACVGGHLNLRREDSSLSNSLWKPAKPGGKDVREIYMCVSHI